MRFAKVLSLAALSSTYAIPIDHSSIITFPIHDGDHGIDAKIEPTTAQKGLRHEKRQGDAWRANPDAWIWKEFLRGGEGVEEV